MYEIYAYGNLDTLTGIFNAIAAIMGGADYFGLIRTVGLLGLLVSAFSGLFTPGRFHGWGWLIGFLLLYHLLFLPKVDVVIVDRLGGEPPVAVGNVPIGLAFFGHVTSRTGDVMTRFFETAFQVIPEADAQLPAELTYQRNGVLFGNRLIQAARQVNVTDPQLRTDLIAYVHNCTLYDLQDGTIDPAVFARSTDLWALMGNSNPARFSTRGNPVVVEPCPAIYAYLSGRLPEAVNQARALLAFRLNPALEPAAAQGQIDNQILQAYAKTRIANAAQGAADLLRQNMLINVMEDSTALAGQKLNDPAALMIATARASATASTNASFLTMGRIAEQALPMVRNVIEAITYAVFPFVFLVFLLAHGRALGSAIKAFAMSLIWIQLWPPLYAILNYVATLASARNLEAAARLDAGSTGLALETAASIYSGAISDQAIAGYLVVSIPIIATAILKGGEVAFQAVTAVGQMQSAASAEASATTKGNVSQDAVSIDQQQLAPTRTSPLMTSSSDAHGTTIHGIGADAGVFRYQATMSRLATTFTFSEKQATTLSDQAREAETQAKSERDAMVTSQSAALTHALGIQESYERSKQRSGTSATSDGGSTSTQLQTLNSIAKDVNRRLGLSDDSVVGKSVAASASAGAAIPFTSIGGKLETEGRRMDAEKLQSAYDYARRAIESAQLSEASALVKDFRSSQAYQWARSSRDTGTSGIDSAHREALEHQSSADSSHARARELARAAQFMREWSSGIQTDFTNFAARRLSERGLLREDDPIRLQRAVTEIAHSYARGGDVAGQFVSGDNAMPSQAILAARLGWPDVPLGLEPDRTGPSAVSDEASRRDALVHARQSRSGVAASTSVGDDVTRRVDANESAAASAIDSTRKDVSLQQGQLGESYNDSVSLGQISTRHGGNRAVHDTVGVQGDNRARLGVPPQAARSGNADDIPGSSPAASVNSTKGDQPSRKDPARQPPSPPDSGRRGASGDW